MKHTKASKKLSGDLANLLLSTEETDALLILDILAQHTTSFIKAVLVEGKPSPDEIGSAYLQRFARYLGYE